MSCNDAREQENKSSKDITCSQMAKVPIVAGGRSTKFTFETARWFCFSIQSFWKKIS
jgi:hypothetical protein